MQRRRHSWPTIIAGWPGAKAVPRDCDKRSSHYCTILCIGILSIGPASFHLVLREHCSRRSGGPIPTASIESNALQLHGRRTYRQQSLATARESFEER